MPNHPSAYRLRPGSSQGLSRCMKDLNPPPLFASPELAELLERMVRGEEPPADDLSQSFTFLPVTRRSDRD